MRSSTILCAGALTVTTMATAQPNLHAVADVIARAIDPETMDPTKLSVLSVLKTAIPSTTGTDIVLPTGDALPQWYKELPADVMVLLAQMYPAAPTAAAVAVSETASASADADASSSPTQGTLAAPQTTTLTRTLELVPAASASSNATLSASSEGQSSASVAQSAGTPRPTESASSAGAKNTAGTGLWSAVTGLGVAICFFVFA